MMVLLLYITVVLPYRMAFDDEAAVRASSDALAVSRRLPDRTPSWRWLLLE